jgi:DNA helicase HerA-like ATPase
MERYKRGALVKTGWHVWKRVPIFAGRAGARPLELAGLTVGPADETKHFKFIGTTGTGKSTAITELLEGALERGDRAVFADPDGGYLARFHDRGRGDVILNPFDPRSVKWDPFAEVHTACDVE